MLYNSKPPEFNANVSKHFSTGAHSGLNRPHNDKGFELAHLSY